jgi:hypothetical protein
MHLVLTEEDLAKLSPECRSELQLLFFGPASVNFGTYLPSGIDAQTMPVEGIERDFLPAWPDDFEKSGTAKTVVDLGEAEAQALLANLSAKSVETLRLFASSESVALDALVGSGKAYKNLSELKRSFVGAVNRRLRTVTRNRTAVLFRKVEGSEGIRIAVRPSAATALHQALSSVNEKD